MQTQAAAEAEVPVDFVGKHRLSLKFLAESKHFTNIYPEEITLDMYWSGLECGLAIIAACLPKLSYLFNRFSIQSAVNSVRSVFSLQSMRSGNLKSENNPAASANPYVDIESGSKTSSQAQIFGKGEPMMSIDQYPMEMFPKVTATQGGTPTYRDGLETKARS